jgi:hypothetical protein
MPYIANPKSIMVDSGGRSLGSENFGFGRPEREVVRVARIAVRDELVRRARKPWVEV